MYPIDLLQLLLFFPCSDVITESVIPEETDQDMEPRSSDDGNELQLGKQVYKISQWFMI